MNAFYRALTLSAAVLAATAGHAQLKVAMSPEEEARLGRPVDVSKLIGLDYKLGGQIEADVPVTEADGRTIRFSDLFGKRPVLVMPLFFRCATACPLETDNLLKVLVKEETSSKIRKMAAAEAQNPGAGGNAGVAGEYVRAKHLLVGRDFDVVFLGIHPKETPLQAQSRRALVNEVFAMGWKDLPKAEQEANLASVDRGFHYLVGKPEDIKRITDSIGFRFFYNAPKDQMNHVAASVLLSPTGKIATYFTGTEYATRVLAAGVDLAARNEVGPEGDKFLLGCIMVDPVTGKRTLVFNRILMVACFLTVGVLGASIFVMNRRHPDRLSVKDLTGDATSTGDASASGGDGAA